MFASLSEPPTHSVSKQNLEVPALSEPPTHNALSLYFSPFLLLAICSRLSLLLLLYWILSLWATNLSLLLYWIFSLSATIRLLLRDPLVAQRPESKMIPNPFAKTTIIENGHHQSIVVLLATATAMVLQKVIRPGKRILVCPRNIVPKNSVLISFWARLSPEGGIVENYTPIDINLLSSSSKIVLGYAGHDVIVAQTSTAENTFAQMRATVQIKEAARKFGNLFRGVPIQPVDE